MFTRSQFVRAAYGKQKWERGPRFIYGITTAFYCEHLFVFNSVIEKKSKRNQRNWIRRGKTVGSLGVIKNSSAFFIESNLGLVNIYIGGN